MDFISNSDIQNREMLAAIGIQNIEELFYAIPKKLRLDPPVEDDGLSEYEGILLMEQLAHKNQFPHMDNYLGAGAYEHHVPALVGAICTKSEFLTAYTPYQAEASQGMLQSIFEFQSAICALTGLDVSNASVYDGASACAEALLMSIRSTKRNKVLIAHSLHPHYRSVCEQYLSHPEVEIKTVPLMENGLLDREQLDQYLTEEIAALLIPYPNFFGSLEDVKSLSQKAKKVGALILLCANPLVYGLYPSARELGADIAVGDCQPLGLPLQFGGPYAGYMTCREELVRQLPGRIVGQTIDTHGRKGFVLTLQAREQHIRREKATSNICTNQALAALASLVTMLWYGKQGMAKLALTNYQRASYLKEHLEAIFGTHPFSNQPFLNEFVIQFPHPIEHVQQHFRKHHIEPGVALEKFFPELRGTLLIAVTETKSKQQLDHYCEVARNL